MEILSVQNTGGAMVKPGPLDLRHLEVWERANQVLALADALVPEESFDFLTEVSPRALISRLAASPRCVRL